VNLRGIANMIRRFVPPMAARNHGVIVNMSSGWGRSAASHFAPYSATKWAVEGLTRSLAEELPQGMAAVSLSPGVVNTHMLQICLGERASSSPDPESWAKRAVPLLLGLGPKHNGQPLSVPG
jgi:NAD(P)-dependent dehydrogenase (short-subunit alcohol dehydrogenase family)